MAAMMHPAAPREAQLAAAIRLHQQGQLDAAEAAYAALLKRQPRHLMGCIFPELPRCKMAGWKKASHAFAAPSPSTHALRRRIAIWAAACCDLAALPKR